MSFKVFHVDAFANAPFSGNPAAVCILEEARSYIWMQRVAEEMNLSETVFIQQQEDGFNLRWFTPTVEVELCGHATLASAHILWEQGYLEKSEEAHFSTQSGWLHARCNGEWIEMDFPSEEENEVAIPKDLASALDLPIKYVGQNRFDYLVEVANETLLRALIPNIHLLKSLPIRGICVTAPSSLPEYDFVSRFFAPGVGINEDPVTGSAHCYLGPYWAKRTGKKDLTGYQASRRGGMVRVRVEEDHVVLAGQAVTISSAELTESVYLADQRLERSLAM
ncbi:MAG TPA: PhzF family phenazine biosynthesis protein [Candidatus Obscuribacterales bacterium]